MAKADYIESNDDQFNTQMQTFKNGIGGYAGPPPPYWQIWARSDGNVEWFNLGETQTSDFPQGDDTMAPEGAIGWQVKLCGEGEGGIQSTPFSNIISFGPGPF